MAKPAPALLTHVATALVWLTRLPVGRLLPAASPPLARAAWAFPLVGIIVAAGAGTVLIVAAWLGLPPLVAALLAVAAGLWLTGGLHEDGLADFADGCGAASRDRALEIMRDSRIGSYGVIALILALGLRVAALAAMPVPLAVAALFAAAALSRAGMAAGLGWLPPARPDGLGQSAGRPSRRGILAAALIAAAVLIWPAGLTESPALFWAFALICCAIAQFCICRYARRRLVGQNGVVLGAMQQVGETAVLIALAAT